MSSWNQIAPFYDKQIYSLTKWKSKRQRILNQLKNPKHILIIGCGSATYLQRAILDLFPNTLITLSDLSEKMLEESKKAFNHEKLKFIQEDMSKISYSEEFDYIISTNSILFPTIQENDEVILKLIQVLKPKGKLIAYFPSFESCVRLSHYGVRFDLNKKEQSIDDGCGFVQSFFVRSQLYKNKNKGETRTQIVTCSESYNELKSIMNIYDLSREKAKLVFEYFSVFIKN